MNGSPHMALNRPLACSIHTKQQPKGKIVTLILLVLNLLAWGCKKDDTTVNAGSPIQPITLISGFGSAETTHFAGARYHNFAALNLTEFDSVRASFTADWEPPSQSGVAQLSASGEQFYIGDSLTFQKSFSRTIHSYQITNQNSVQFRLYGAYVKVWGFSLIGWRKS